MTQAPPTCWQRTRRLLLRWPGLVVVPVVLIVAALGSLSWQHGPVLCPFRLTTGLPCAGCGLTRAFLALMHGQWQAAIGFNQLTPFVLVWMVSWWLVAVVALVRGRDVPALPRWLPRLGLIVVVSFWIGRIVWFATQAQPWQRMIADSPVMRVVDAVLRRLA